MIEAVKIWNEPNNKSHWDPNLDPEWDLFANMTCLAGQAIREANPDVTRVLGGMSPIDPGFIRRLEARGVMEAVDVVAVHGFPLDWNLWSIDEWPAKVGEIQAVTDKPVWVTEVGVSAFGSEEVQAWGVRKTADLLIGRAPRIFWYSLYDLPQAWEATTRHKEAEGSSYYRHFHMGLLREDGSPKAALEASTRYIARDLGPKNIRVNAISAGAMRTLSLAGISGGRGLHSKSAQFSLIKEETSMEGVAGAALWLCSDLGRSTTGEVVHVDAGFHAVGLPEDIEG